MKMHAKKPSPVLSPAVQGFVAAIVLLGLVGGSLIVGYAGFATSPKRGGLSTFVPVPEAYFLAATMYGMSFIGMLALLRALQVSRSVLVVALVMYVFVAAALPEALRALDLSTGW
jgi:hypothetical protein